MHSFVPDQIEGLRIKEDDEYEGVRVLVPGALSGAQFKVQIDIGFGDAVTPPPVIAAFPRMLNMQPFSLLTYPPETVFAEKLDALVIRGLLNSRMKDYYDLSILIREGMVQPDTVRQAVENTFEREWIYFFRNSLPACRTEDNPTSTESCGCVGIMIDCPFIGSPINCPAGELKNETSEV